jgi:hypothetical protein
LQSSLNFSFSFWKFASSASFSLLNKSGKRHKGESRVYIKRTSDFSRKVQSCCLRWKSHFLCWFQCFVRNFWCVSSFLFFFPFSFSVFLVFVLFIFLLHLNRSQLQKFSRFCWTLFRKNSRCCLLCIKQSKIMRFNLSEGNFLMN